MMMMIDDGWCFYTERSGLSGTMSESLEVRVEV